MDEWARRLAAVPIAVWVMIAAGVAIGLRYLFLLQTASGNEDGPNGQEQFAAIWARLREEAARNAGRLPASLDGFAADGVAYRPMVGAVPDEKVLIAHDDRPRRRIVQFPFVREGRYVLFWSGRIVLVTESAFERLIEADEVLRGRDAVEEGDGPQEDPV